MKLLPDNADFRLRTFLFRLKFRLNGVWLWTCLPLLLVLPFVGMAARVPDNSFFFPLAVLAIPVAFAIFVLPLVRGEENFNWKHAITSWSFWKGKLIAYPLLLFYLWFPYIAVNGIISVGSPVRYQGFIVQKYISSSGKSGQLHYLVLEKTDGEKISLHVPKLHYKYTEFGAMYCAEYNRGWLGVTFAWTWDWSSGGRC